MTTNYTRGVTAERYTLDWFMDNGHCAVRTAGSHGPVDVIAWNNHTLHLVQVKRSKTRPGNAAREPLLWVPRPRVTHVELWYYKPRSTTPEIWRCP